MDPKKNLSHLSPEEKSRSAQLDITAVMSFSPKKRSPTHHDKRDKDEATLKENSAYQSNKGTENENSFKSRLNISSSKIEIDPIESNQTSHKIQSRFAINPIDVHLVKGRKDLPSLSPTINKTISHFDDNGVTPKTPLKRNPDIHSPGEGFSTYLSNNIDYNGMNLDEMKYHLAKYDTFKAKCLKTGVIDDNYLLILRKHLGRIIREMPEGSTFGERGIQGSLLRTASVITKTKCRVLVLPLKKFHFALKAIAKEKAAQKFRLLAAAIPEVASLSYEQYFQFQYHFEERSIVRDTILIPEGRKDLVPCLIATGECLIFKENSPASLNKLESYIHSFEENLTEENYSIYEQLKSLFKAMKKFTGKTINLGIIGPGELLGSEITFPEIGESLFSYRVTSSELVYYSMKGTLSQSATRQIQSSVATKLQHRIGIIRKKTETVKLSKLQVTEESKLENSNTVAIICKKSPPVAFDGHIQRTQVKLMIKSEVELDSKREKPPKLLTVKHTPVISKLPPLPEENKAFFNEMKLQVKGKNQQDGIINFLIQREAMRPTPKSLLEEDDQTSKFL